MVTHLRGAEQDGEKALGMFLNTLPFRQVLRPGSWTELIRSTFASELEMMPHRFYPYAQVFLDNERVPPSEVMFNYINFHVYEALREVPEIEVLGGSAFEATEFAMVVNAVNQDGKLVIDLGFDPDRISSQQIESIAGYYQTILQTMVIQPDSDHEIYSCLSELEKQLVLYEWNDDGTGVSAGQVCA